MLQRRSLLLVLDNCEHLIDACAIVATRLLQASEGLRILATSREPLGIPGESVFRVPPLGVPADPSASTGFQDEVEAVAIAEAVQLFVQRASAVQPSFSVNSVNALAIGEVCRRVDGIPLAIELAAARMAALGPADLAARLDEGFRVLVSDTRTAPERQRTLFATIDWSYGQLSPAEQDVFDRLSVFASATPAAAAAVISSDVLERVSRLAAVSLIQAEPADDGSIRYRLLVPLRHFGQERLTERGLLDEARQRHAEYFVQLAAEAGPLGLGNHLVWIREVIAELDNLRAAHDWLVKTHQTELALRLAAALGEVWNRPDLRSEGTARLREVLALPAAAHHAESFGRAVTSLGMISLMRSDMSAATEQLECGLQLARRNRDAWFESTSLVGLGMLHLFRGELDRAAILVEQALTIARQLDSPFLEARCLNSLVDLELARGDLAGAEARARASVRLSQGTHDVFSHAMALTSLGDVQRSMGDLALAGEAYAQARDLFDRLGPGRPYHGLLHNMGYVQLGEGHAPLAASLFLVAADAYQRAGTDARGVAECLVGLAAVAVHMDEPMLGGLLTGTAEATLEAIGSSLSPSNRADYERTRAALEAALETQEFTIALTRGRTLTLDEALAAARRLADTSVSDSEF